MARGAAAVVGARIAPLVAVLGLLLHLAAPPGFRLAADGGGATIVVCTLHGPLAAHLGGPGGPGRTPDSKGGAACAYACHAAAPLAPAPAPAPATAAFALAPPRLAGLDLAPGRGLAAPPPPSRAPPAAPILA